MTQPKWKLLPPERPAPVAETAEQMLALLAEWDEDTPIRDVAAFYMTGRHRSGVFSREDVAACEACGLPEIDELLTEGLCPTCEAEAEAEERHRESLKWGKV